MSDRATLQGETRGDGSPERMEAWGAGALTPTEPLGPGHLKVWVARGYSGYEKLPFTERLWEMSL